MATSASTHWYDWQGVDVTDGELMEYISESSMMSKALVEYEGAPGSRAGHARSCRPLAKHQHQCQTCAYHRYAHLHASTLCPV